MTRRPQAAQGVILGTDRTDPISRPPGFIGRPTDGALAQLVERLHGMQEVRGSTPLGSTSPFWGELPKLQPPQKTRFFP